ncbi:hypothetical protein ACP70R_017793 [Stipagrostis hirtigluma subsp. patula]
MANLHIGAAAGFLNLIITEWAIRVVVICSLVAHVVLALVAGIRRRESTSFGTLILWLAYQVADGAAPWALGKLTLGSTLREQQLVALWVPFLLIHLGGTDNIIAYSLEDNKLFSRQLYKTVVQFLGTPLAIYKQYIASGGNGALFWASVVMSIVGFLKYVERVRALQKSDFGKIRTSRKKQPEPESLRIQPLRSWQKKLKDEQALLVAHELLHITKGAFADYTVSEHLLQQDPNLKEIFSIMPGEYGWENMCKVVEMELSLMYDILYTKAVVTHTWVGYFIRVTSPIATTTVTILFCFHFSKEGQRIADIIITYVLLVVTLLLDIRWLLRAIASTWTYAFLNHMPECWIQHEVLCTGRWSRLRRAIISLDLRSWLLPMRGGSYRLWAGKIGQYNLIHECTYDTASPFSKTVKMVASDDTLMEYRYSKEPHISQKIKELLFQQIGSSLQFSAPLRREPLSEMPKPEFHTVLKRRRLDEAQAFIPEFPELILTWHIATDIFLLYNHQQLVNSEGYVLVEAIKAVSNYMVFLVKTRPDILPGLRPRSLYDVTRSALKLIWRKKGGRSQGSKTREQNLARILVEMEERPLEQGKESDLYKANFFLSDGTKFAKVLQEWLIPDNQERYRSHVNRNWYQIRDDVGIRMESEKKFLFLIPEMEKWKGWYGMQALLISILNSWVRMLIFVSARCSRDSHAKQLGRGCELTTIVWILADHAGIFGHEGRNNRKYS